MKILIPIVGDKIKINKNTDIVLKNISQNVIFLKKYDEKEINIKQFNKNEHNILIPKDTVLTIDRVYIRQGSSSEYNSITFKVNGDDNLPNGRFFISIAEANKLDADFIGQVHEEKPIKILKHLMNITERRKICGLGTACETLIKKEESYRFNINLNCLSMFDILIKDIEYFFINKFKKNIEEIKEEVIKSLTSDTFNLDKINSKENIENLNILKKIDFNHSKIKQILLKNNVNSFFEIIMYKLKEEQPLSTQHIIRFEQNKKIEENLNIIRIYLNNIIYILNKYNNSELRNFYSYNNIKYINNITKLEKWSSLSTFKNRLLFNYFNDEFPSDCFNYNYITYEQIKECNVLNVKNFENYNLGNYIEFIDHEGFKNIKNIRSMLTKNKKK